MIVSKNEGNVRNVRPQCFLLGVDNLVNLWFIRKLMGRSVNRYCNE